MMRADLVAFLSDWAAQSAWEDYGLDPGKTVVIGVGSRFSPSAEALRARSWEVPRFLWVGMDWRRKNGALVLDAFSEIRARHPKATIDLVGVHPADLPDGATGHGVLPRGRRMPTRVSTSCSPQRRVS